MALAHGTVRNIIASIRGKLAELGASTRVELARLAWEMGIEAEEDK